MFPKRNNVELAFVFFGFLLASILFYKNCQKFFWLDEVTTLNISNQATLIGVIEESKRENIQPPLFYLAGTLWSLFNLKPEWLRTLPFFCYLGILYLLIRNLKASLFSYLVLMFYFFSATDQFTAYLITEFRPYSMSLFLFTFFFHFVINYKESDSFFYIKSSFFLVLFSSTLSLNIPIGLGFLVVLTIFFIFKFSTHTRKTVRLSLIGLGISYFLVLSMAFYVKSGADLFGNFNYSFFISELQKNSQIVFSDIITFQGVFLISLVVAIALMKVNVDIRILFFTGTLLLLFVFCIAFPTFILHTRIPWYASRYSHLNYLIFPFFILLFSKQFRSILTFSKKPSLSFVLLTFLVSGLVFQNLAKSKMNSDNGIGSIWVEITNQKICKQNDISIVTDPDYIDRVGLYHIALARIAEPEIHGISNLQNQIESKKCILIVNSNHKLTDEYEDKMLEAGYRLKFSNHPHQDWPQNVDTYMLYVRNDR
ncbi:MAG: hypothetical protein O9264_13555 [Leptospira sp.]|nr:hypothetical protein [Leptospira sp.]